MIEFAITIYGLAGVLFFEAARSYRALMSGISIIPDGRVAAYFGILIAFGVITTICANLFAGTSNIAAFLFGFGLPNGLHWALPPDSRDESLRKQPRSRTEDKEDAPIDEAIDDTFNDDMAEHELNSVGKGFLNSYFQI